MHQLAQGIASLGRGQDKMLVHMTPGEVHGLQSLALSHGGSLTINPQTGLPEAGFLSSILPMMAGAVGTAFGGPMGGMIAGGLTGAMTNQNSPLMGGLLGGISGYGMGNLGETFAGMGAGAEATAGAVGSELTGALDPRLGELGINTALPSSAGVPPPQATPQWGSMDAGPGVNQAPPPQGPPQASPQWGSMDAGPGAQAVQQPPAPPGATPPGAPPSVVQNPVNATWEGAKQAASDPWKFASDPTGKYKNAKDLAMAGAPLLSMGLESLGKPNTLNGAAPSKGHIRPYSYTPGTPDPEFQRQVQARGYSNVPYFKGQGFTAGEVYPAAGGGAIGDLQPTLPAQNPMYPGANISGASPMQTSQIPQASEVVGGYEPVTNQYDDRIMRLAEGGSTGANQYDYKAIKPEFKDWVAPPVQTPAAPIAPPAASTGPFSNPAANAEVIRLGGGQAAIDQVAAGWGIGSSGMAGKQQTAAPVAMHFIPDENNANGGYMGYAGGGGIGSLGTYAAGGRLLQGPGDGMSDSIPAVIQGERPQRAALAQGEFVVPADVVSHLGNGSTDAGSKRLYTMMDKVRHARTGTKKQGKKINADKFLPA